MLDGRRAFGDLGLQFLAETPFAFVYLRFGTNALDMRPGTFGDLGDQRQLMVGPLMRMALMDRHQRGQSALLHQRHADGGANADILEGRGFFRLQFLQIVIHYQRLAVAEVCNRQLAEVGQPVVPDDMLRAGRSPVAADGEAVLVGIHVGIGAAGNAQMLADHAGSDRHDRIGVGALGRFFSQRVEKLQALFVLPQPTGRDDRLRDLDHDRDHADRLAAFADHRRVIEVQ
ncbi:MAG: hypothetical protein QOD09_1795 [Bradyrhizobium sp.]|nr:hypothetical protein [Bradyrhizobium sp.]